MEQRRSASVPLTSASSPSPVPLKPPWALRGEVDRPVVKRASVSSWRLEDGNRRSSLDRFCPSPSVWEKADKGGRVRESMQSRASSIGDDGHLAKEVEDEGERGAARATAVGTRKVNFRDSNGLFVQERARVPGLRLAREAGVEHGETACPNEPKGKKNQKPKHPTALEQGDIRALPPALEAPPVGSTKYHARTHAHERTHARTHRQTRTHTHAQVCAGGGGGETRQTQPRDLVDQNVCPMCTDYVCHMYACMLCTHARTHARTHT